jgi:hypothetical protein
MIVETSDNRLYDVGTGGTEKDTPHLWRGIAVKRSKGGFVPKAGKQRIELVRIAGSRIVQAGAR